MAKYFILKKLWSVWLKSSVSLTTANIPYSGREYLAFQSLLQKEQNSDKKGTKFTQFNKMSGSDKSQIPDWKSYKIEGIPELEQVQRRLAGRGLKDPWLRNEVWRYTRENYGGQYRNAAISLGRGLKWALVAMALTVAYDAMHVTKPAHGHVRPGPVTEEEEDEEE